MSHDDAIVAYKRRVEIVKAQLRQDARAIAAELLQPESKIIGRSSWQMLPPHRTSDNDGAFSIRVAGDKAGSWIDFVTGETGDLLNLIMLVKGCDFKAAVAWAEDRYGLRNMSAEQREATSKAIEKRLAIIDENATKAAAEKIRRACLMFSKAVPDIEGTLVETYLATRGIDLAALPNRDRRWVRFLPSATYWMDKTKPQMPVMIAGMVNGQGVMQACHLTFLRADGKGKADVAKPKLMWPATRGLVIRLNNGAGNLTPEEAAAQSQKSHCAIGEGTEDVFSIAMGEPDLRGWAASSLSNLANVPDHDCISSFIVAQDNDWAKPQAQAAFEFGLQHLRSFKKPVVPIRSTNGKDFNDQLKGDAR